MSMSTMFYAIQEYSMPDAVENLVTLFIQLLTSGVNFVFLA